MRMRRSEKEIQNEDEILEILEAGLICRLALCDGDVPYIVPMNYGYAKGCLFFHSASAGTKIDILRRNSQACFEIEVDTEVSEGEAACHWGMKYRSVIGFGKLEEVADSAEKREGLSAIMKQVSASSEWGFPDPAVEKVLVLKMKRVYLISQERYAADL